jgi:hypothetical protein
MNIFRCLFYNGCLDHISISSETSLVNPIPCSAYVQDSSSIGLLYLYQHLHLERSLSTHGDSEHGCAIQRFCHSNLTNRVVQLCYAQSSSRKDVCYSRCLYRTDNNLQTSRLLCKLWELILQHLVSYYDAAFRSLFQVQTSRHSWTGSCPTAPAHLHRILHVR